jgi:hypothetical protein
MRQSLGLMIAAAIFLSQPAFAQWSNNPQAGNEITAVPFGGNLPIIASDGAGGAIIAWNDQRDTVPHIYVQRINAAGIVQWAQNGVRICTSDSSQILPAIASDGQGGAIIAWTDFRSDTADLYAQRISPTGVIQWANSGVAISVAVNNQTTPSVVSDNSGGAVIAWQDDRSGTGRNMYVQRVSGAGVPLWTANGVRLCPTANDQTNHVMVSDDAGGAFVAWQDFRSGTDWDLYARRINGAGVLQGLGGGLPICTATGNQQTPAMTRDGLGGALITWIDNRSGNNDIYAQRVSSTSQILWAPSGAIVSSASGNQAYPDIASDGAGNAIIAWIDFSGTYSQVFAQRMSAQGAVMWLGNGVPVCTTSSNQATVKIVADNSAGAVLTWDDTRNVFNDLYVQHIDKNGITTWNSSGVAISSAPLGQSDPVVVTDGAGGAIVTWDDFRSNTAQIFAGKISANGLLGDGTPHIIAVRDVKNDQGGFVNVFWSSSPYDVIPYQTISSYTIWRGVPLYGSASVIAPGSGAVFPKISAVPGSGNSTVSTVTTDTIGWQQVGNVIAAYRSTYSLAAPTLSDSTPPNTPYYYFMVTANTGYSTGFWDSPVDSGYSVDNLAPAVVAHVGGSFASGTETLHWDANTEKDLAGYVVYRSTSPGFDPGIMTPLGTTANDFYSDATAGVGSVMFYAVEAVDVHGNKSIKSNEVSTVSTGVEQTTVLPTVFALGQNYPNPFNPSTMITYDVPKTSTVHLTIYDLLGRTVAELVNGEKTQGEYHVEWNADRLSSGIYYLHMETQGFVATRKLILMK